MHRYGFSPVWVLIWVFKWWLASCIKKYTTEKVVRRKLYQKIDHRKSDQKKNVSKNRPQKKWSEEKCLEKEIRKLVKSWECFSILTCKRFSTTFFLTTIRFFTCVSSWVFSQITQCGEIFLTVGLNAIKCVSRVEPLMSFQSVQSIESFVTTWNRTTEWFFFRMDSNMDSKWVWS